MTEVNGKKYKLCFLDTCIISEAFKDENLHKALVLESLSKNYFYCCSLHNLYEIRSKRSYNEN